MFILFLYLFIVCTQRACDMAFAEFVPLASETIGIYICFYAIYIKGMYCLSRFK